MASHISDESHNVSSYLNLRHTSGQYDTAIMFVGAAGAAKSTLCNFLSRREKQNETEVLSEICRAGVMAKDGVDAFAFVINLTKQFPEARHETQ